LGIPEPHVIAVIPARYASTRLPGKVLADIGGRPMIQRVVERVARARTVSRVLVATDDERVYDCVRGFGAEVVMTPEDIPSGTDRVARAVSEMDTEIVLNVQGDEPFIDPDAVDAVAGLLTEDTAVPMATLIRRIDNIEELVSPQTAKVVMDEEGFALYFSRSPIPFFRDIAKEDWISNQAYYRHVSVYGFRKDFLMRFASWAPARLESLEKLEQLRVLEKGFRIKTAVTTSDSFGVDTPEDLERARRRAAEMGDAGRR